MLQDEKIGLERARRDEVGVLCREMLSASPELAEKAAKALLQKVSWFRKQYKPGKTALENYRSVPGMWVEMDRYLEEHYPDRFTAIREKYDERLEAIDKKIGELTKEQT
jgi:hypothetical protein